jgi:hypothetical protein
LTKEIQFSRESTLADRRRIAIMLPGVGKGREAWVHIGCLLLPPLMACSSEAPSKVQGAPARPPDDSYETDGARAYRVLVWKCDARNERISMVQGCAEGLTGCGRWHVDRTLCPLDPPGRDATRTASEGNVAARGHGRHPIPTGYGWR